MKKIPTFLALLSMIAISGATFSAGWYWRDQDVKRQLASTLRAQLVCEASSLKDEVAVASLLESQDGEDAKEVLNVGIQMNVGRLRVFEPNLDQSDHAEVMDALRDGESYLSTRRAR